MISADLLLSKYVSGDLLDFLLEEDHHRDDQGIVTDMIAQLHNSGEINVLSAFSTEKLSQYSGFTFLQAQNFFCDLMPKLNANVRELIETANNLVKLGGNDLASHFPHDSFRTWLSLDQKRYDEVIRLAESGWTPAYPVLSSSLQLGAFNDPQKYLDMAIRIANANEDERRAQVIHFIGRMTIVDSVAVQKIRAALTSYIESAASDEVNFNLIACLISLSKKIPASEYEWIETLLEKVFASPNPQTLHAAAISIEPNVSPGLLKILLRFLLEVNPDHKGTIDSLDYGLSRLLSGSSDVVPVATDFLESLLIRKHDAIELDNLQSTSRAILKDTILFSRLLTKWFLSEERYLIEQIAHLATSSPDMKGDALAFDKAQIADDQKVRKYLAHKAIGFCFTKSVSCASLILSVASLTADYDIYLEDLLVTPLLENYPGEVSEYLAELVKSDDSMSKYAINALKRHSASVEALERLPIIRELHPNESQIGIARQLKSDQMREVFKGAQEKSVFYNLVSRSTLLYGRKCVSYIDQGDGNSRRMENTLGTIGTSVEYPRLLALDPLGLEYMLMKYRAEKLSDETPS